MGYDSCPLFTMLTKQKKLLDALHSKLVKKKQEWSIFPGDLPIHTHSGLFSGATSPRTHTDLFFKSSLKPRLFTGK
jgi:predicted YcjX-like family ATPase